MANVLVYIRTEGATPAPQSLHALAHARRVSSHLGATVYAAITSPLRASDCLALISAVGHGGADRVLLYTSNQFSSPALWSTRGHIIARACTDLNPRLVFFAGDASGTDIAPRLAARLDGRFFPEPTIDCTVASSVVLRRTSFGRSFVQVVAADVLERPAVITVSGAIPSGDLGSDDVEVQTIAVDDAHHVPTILESTPDPGATLEAARLIVCAGAGCSHHEIKLVKRLAAALGGVAACTLGRVQAEPTDHGRIVDISRRLVAPDVYIACGASGSPNHLAAVSRSSELIAVNSDPDAPILHQADHAVVGRVSDVLPQVLAELAKRSAEVETQ